MSSESYPTLRVGDFAHVKGGKRMPAGTALTSEKTSHPYLRIVDFKDGSIDTSNLQYVPDEVFSQISRYVISANDLYISIVGTIGLVGAVPASLDGANLTENAAKICDIDSTRINTRYLNYYLRSDAGQTEINALTVGSTQPKLALFRIEQIEVPVPSLNTQQSIADILGALDDRITLLRETNATLEAIAQALFKSWFVDFDPVRAKMEGRIPEGMDEATAALFPDGLEESELGEVPRGWRSASIRDCCIKVESGGTPKRTTTEYWNGTHFWLTSGEVRNPIVFETKEKITDAGLRGSAAKIWSEGTTVVAMYGATAGEVCLIASPMTANQACCGLIPRASFRSFLFFCSRRARESLASKSSGSAQQNLNKGLVEEHQILLPGDEVIGAFERCIGVLLDRWIMSERQAKTLSNLRDTLLPRLISGQLRLPEMQAQLDEALS